MKEVLTASATVVLMCCYNAHLAGRSGSNSSVQNTKGLAQCTELDLVKGHPQHKHDVVITERGIAMAKLMLSVPIPQSIRTVAWINPETQEIIV